MAILKIYADLRLQFLLVCRAKDQIKIKIYAQKAILVFGMDNSYIPLAVWYGLAFIVNQKRKNKNYKQEKVDDRIAVLLLARSRSKRQKETEI